MRPRPHQPINMPPWLSGLGSAPCSYQANNRLGKLTSLVKMPIENLSHACAAPYDA